MTVSVRNGRLRRARPRSRGSVREVCLVGVARPAAAGDRVTWSGRVYRVESTQAHPADAAADDVPVYMHLAAEPGG